MRLSIHACDISSSSCHDSVCSDFTQHSLAWSSISQQFAFHRLITTLVFCPDTCAYNMIALSFFTPWYYFCYRLTPNSCLIALLIRSSHVKPLTDLRNLVSEDFISIRSFPSCLMHTTKRELPSLNRTIFGHLSSFPLHPSYRTNTYHILFDNCQS